MLSLVFLLAAAALGQLEANFYDILIYGATPGGIAAAIAAAKLSSSVSIALLSPDPYIGGMSSAGGIGLRDIGILSTIPNGSFPYQWGMQNAKYYDVDYPVWQPDNYVGNQSFWTMLASYPSIDVITDQPLVLEAGSVVKEGAILMSIATGQGSLSDDITWWNATVFIDASYDGDIIIQSGVSWTYGREPRDQYNESYAGVQPYTQFGQFLVNVDPFFPNGTLMPYVDSLPLAPIGSGDSKIMAYSYRACITTNKDNQIPFPQPQNYNPQDFALFQAYVAALTASSGAPNFDFLVGAYPYRSYPPGDKTDLCDSNNAAITTDAVQLNQGYPISNRTVRQEIAAKIKYYVQGFIYFLANDPSVPQETQQSVQAYGLCKDEWPENDNWPLQLYIREGVRLIGDFVITQNDIVGGQCRNDSVGLGSWADDIHVVQRVAVANANGTGFIARNEGEMMSPYPGNGGAFPMPYGLLLPKISEATNFLVPVQNSISHAGIGGVREEPEYMQLGTAAGIAAVLTIENNNIPVQNVNITALQQVILSQNGIIQPGPC